MRASRMHVVADPSDIREHYEHVVALHDLVEGRAVCELTTGGRNAFWLAQDILDGLGKRPDGLSGGREAWMSLDRAATWLAGEGVKTLFVLRADERDAGAWKLLVTLAAQVGFDLWLLTNSETLPRGHREFLTDWQVEHVSWQEFIEQWPAPPRGAPRAAADATTSFSLLGIPRDDFPTFRAACRRLLSPQAFKRVDSEFASARERVRRCLAESHSFRRDDVLAHVRELLEEAASLDARVARLRGAQVALFGAGHLLSVRIELLASSFVNASRAPVDEHTSAALREHHHTRAVAAAILTLLAGTPPAELVRLTMGCVRPGAVAVRLERQWHTVPAHARGLVNAHLHQRLLDGAGEDDPFLAVRDRDARPAPMSPENLRKELGRLSRLSGVLLVSDWTRHANEGVEAWLSRRGVALRPLPGIAQPATTPARRTATMRRNAA